MIDYAYLCQAIADSRAGRRPTMPPSATPTLSGSGVTSTAPIELYPEVAAEMSAEVDMDSEVLDVEDQQDVPLDGNAESEAVDPGGEPTAEPPPDYDATMVYGSGGELPNQGWNPAADTDGETTREG
jgi:hypothetical protein